MKKFVVARKKTSRRSCWSGQKMEQLIELMELAKTNGYDNLLPGQKVQMKNLFQQMPADAVLPENLLENDILEEQLAELLGFSNFKVTILSRDQTGQLIRKAV